MFLVLELLSLAPTGGAKQNASSLTCVDLAAEAGVTFYITPTVSSTKFIRASDCPHNVSDRFCITLDDFTKYSLPDINQNKTCHLTLIFLQGTHSLTTSEQLKFDGVQHLAMFGLGHLQQGDSSLPLIQLVSGGISVTLLKSLEVKSLIVNGNHNHTLTVMVKSYDANFSVGHTVMVDTVLQIVTRNDLSICPFFSVFNTTFTESIIEIYGCLVSVLNRSIVISDSIFEISRKQPYTFAVCPLWKYNKPSLPINRYDPTYMNPTMQIANVEVFDFEHPGEQTSSNLPLVYCNSSILIDQQQGDIYIGNSSSVVNLTITNSRFSRSYGSAIQSVHSPRSSFTIKNCSFVGYTQGVFVFGGNLNGVIVRLVNTTVANNSISTQGVRGAGLVIVPSTFPKDNPMVVEIVNSSFLQNFDHVGNSQIILLQGVAHVFIVDSVFTGNNGTVIGARESNITFAGYVMFENNSAWQGGALFMSSSIMTVSDNTTVNFSGNHAIHFGGAIFINDCEFYLKNDPSTQQICFYQPSYAYYSHPSFENANIKFYNNSAGEGGDCIYGTSIRNYCQMLFQGSQPNPGNDHWKHLFDVDLSGNTSLSTISSNAMRVCLCDSNAHPQCTDMSKIFHAYHRPVYPGEVFDISVAVVGAEFGTTVGEVYSKLLPLNASSSASLRNSFNFLSRSRCTSLNFIIDSSSLFETIYLTSTDITLRYYGNADEIERSISDFNHSEVIPYSLLTVPVFVNVTLHRECPRGFTLVKNGSFCDCYSELRSKDITCTLKDGKGLIFRAGNNWVGRNAENETNGIIIFNHLCPTDHCKLSEVSINLNADNNSELDSQCAFHHGGKLCGGCEEGYSLAIGSSHCLKCTNNDNLALLLFFAAAGPLLFMVIVAFDLTIARGYINGLIFYANIVWVYQSIVFDDNTINTKPYRTLAFGFKIFIAWLNLDFGIETCFFVGLDAFWKSLLQYVFPLYILFIAWLVKVVYNCISIRHFQNCYPKILRIMGKPVDVLTTFVFLSYTKILQTIVAGFAYATLTYYPNNTQKVVWAVDGNIPYFSQKHIAVFVFALLSLIFASAYTIYILLAGLPNTVRCGNCLSSDDSESGRFRVIRLCKSLLDMPLPLRDSHFLPLKDEHRYWFGILLLVRIVLLVVFSTTYLYPHTNLLILMIMTTVLLCYMGWKKVYNKDSVWFLQGSSLSNLIILSGALLSCTDVQKPIIVCISLAVAVFQFLGIVIYPFAQRCFKKSEERLNGHLYSTQATDLLSSDDDTGHTDTNTVESKEPVYDQRLRESLLSEIEPLLGHSSRAKREKDIRDSVF